MKRLLVAIAVSVAGVTSVVAAPTPAAALQSDPIAEIGYLLQCIPSSLTNAVDLQDCLRTIIDELTSFIPTNPFAPSSTTAAAPALTPSVPSLGGALPNLGGVLPSLPGISTLAAPSLTPTIALPSLSNIQFSAPNLLQNLPISLTPAASVSDVVRADDSSSSPVSASDALVLAGLAGLALVGGRRKLRHSNAS